MRFIETTDLPVGDLHPYPGNPRVHDEAALDESIGTNGQYRAIVARRLPDGTHQILAGHGTRNAVHRSGVAVVRVEVIEADDTEARRIVLADNRTSELASYDDRALLDLMDAASRDGGLLGTGWDGDSYRELLDEFESENPFDFRPDADPDEQDVEPPEEPVTTLGDVWALGDHRLVCGDSTDPAAWSSLMGGGMADCVWTDPPYGVAYVGKTKDALTIENDSLDEDGLRRLIDGALGRALTASRPGAAWYVAAPPGPLHLVFANWLHAKGIYRQQLVWVKDQFVLGHGDYHYRHEPLFYGWAPGAAHHATPDRTQDSVWEIPRPKRSEDHPTMKPVELVTRALGNSTDRGQTVVDPFSGSGTTIIACQMTGRRGRGIELDPKYCDVIARRWQDLTGENPILERTGEAWDFTADPPCPTPSSERTGSRRTRAEA